MKDIIFYIITSPSTEKVYIGSTRNKYLCQRKANHYAEFKKYKAGNSHYCTAYDILKFNDAEFSILNIKSCKTEQERFKIEGDLIRETKNTINQVVNIGTTPAETRKRYKEKNNEKLTALIHCECGGEFQFKNKARHYKGKRHLEKMNLN